MRIKVAPSILSADFSRLDRELAKVKKAGADLIHVDVMDGHFVPNITIGPTVVKYLRKATTLPLDVHLMIEDPVKFIEPFLNAGSDMITVHIETVNPSQVRSLAGKARARGAKLGISLNPATPLRKIRPVLKYVDFVLVMSVNPGFGGQAFIESAVPKIRQLRAVFKKDISVDGGINDKTAAAVIRAGATILAAGSYVFGAKNTKQAIERIRHAG